MSIGAAALILQNAYRAMQLCGISAAIKTLVHPFGLAKKNPLARLKIMPDFHVRVGTSDLAVCRQVIFNEEYAFSTSHPVSVVVDAGANIGCATVWFARKYPSAKIIAVEPDLDNFELLQRNVSHLPNVIPIRAAIWPRDQELVVEDVGGGKWGLRVSENVSACATGGQKVAGLTVESILSQFELSSIDILKMDIEGGELRLFLGDTRFLDKVRVLIVEAHDRWFPGTTRAIICVTECFDYEWVQGENQFFCKTVAKPTHIKTDQYARIQ